MLHRTLDVSVTGEISEIFDILSYFFRTDVGQMQRRRHHITVRDLQLSSYGWVYISLVTE